MKFFIDTANLTEIKAAQALGVLDGVTTNPSLIHKSGRDFMEVTREICGITEKGRVEWIIASPLLGKIGEREA